MKHNGYRQLQDHEIVQDGDAFEGCDGRLIPTTYHSHNERTPAMEGVPYFRREEIAEATPTRKTSVTGAPVTGNPKDSIGDTKPDLSLVPPALMIHVAKVMELGAVKYGPYNWRDNKVRCRVYLAAAMRHLQQYLDREDVDPESGQPHIAHAASCCGILLDALATDSLIDDRPKAGAASKLIKQYTKTKPKPGAS